MRTWLRSHSALVTAVAAATLLGGGLLTASAAPAAGSAAYIPIRPCRIMDTRAGRDNVGPRATPLGPDETYTMSVRGDNGRCAGIPADVLAVTVNVAAISPTAASFLTMHPAGAPRPMTANLNWVPFEQPVSNSATVRLSADGRLSLYNLTGQVELSVDVSGYYVDTAHDHDIRYHTKAELDALMEAAKNRPLASADIVDGTVTGADLAVGAVSALPLGAGLSGTDLQGITGADIQPIDGQHLTDLTGAEIADGSLRAADIRIWTFKVDGTTSPYGGGGVYNIPQPASQEFGGSVPCPSVATLENGALGFITVHPGYVSLIPVTKVFTYDTAGNLAPRSFELIMTCNTARFPPSNY